MAAPSVKQRATTLKRQGFDDGVIGAILGLSSDDVRALLLEADPQVALPGVAAASASIWVDWDTPSVDIPAGEPRDLTTSSESVYVAPIGDTFETPDPELFGVEAYAGNGTLLSDAPFDQQVIMRASGLYLVTTYLTMNSDEYAGEINVLKHRFPGSGDTALEASHHFHATGGGAVVATEQFLASPTAALYLRVQNPTAADQRVSGAQSLISRLSPL